MNIVNTHTDSPEKEAGVLEAVRFKCDLLWTLLDGVELAYRDGYLEAG
jgi:pyrroloquinoline quinone (PQQ) biosynthesis protein C